MTQLNVIAMTRFLRSKGWPFRPALDTARAVRTLANNGTLPAADINVMGPAGSEPVTILQLEIAGGVVRLTLTPLSAVLSEAVAQNGSE